MRKSVLVSTPLFLAASCALLAPVAQASVINTVIAKVSVGVAPSGVAVSTVGANAGDVYVTNRGDNTVSVIGPSNTVIATIPVGIYPCGVAVSQAGENAGDVYVINNAPGTVSVIDPSNTVVATITVGNNPFGVAVSSVGANAGDVYVTNSGDNTVSVIDPTNTVVATIPVGSGPIEVAVSPTGANAGDVYVVNEDDGTVSVIGPSLGPSGPQQAYGRSQSGTCDDNAPSWVNWPGIASQQYASWGMSWQQWPNNGTGGFVCERQPSLTSAGTWTVQAQVQ